MNNLSLLEAIKAGNEVEIKALVASNKAAINAVDDKGSSLSLCLPLSLSLFIPLTNLIL